MIILLVSQISSGQEPTRWRGPNGNGVYPESGLLKEWPAGGPEVLWSFGEMGQGHSSAVVDQGHVYGSGMIDGTGFIFKFDLEGNLVFKEPYGPEYSQSYYGTRGTPVIVGPKIYVVSGMGKLYCLSNTNGKVLWMKDLLKDFDGRNIRWGMNETPVVDGDRIYVTPGGRTNNVVALDRQTGRLIWSSRGEGELSAYCTPLLFNHNGRKILATHTENHLIGIDAGDGKMLWSVRHTNQWSVHPNTPIYSEGRLFYFSGYGEGGGLLELSADGSSVNTLWKSDLLDSRIGGAVLIDGYLYGSGDNNREWKCLNWDTGKEMYSSREIAKGAVIAAEGMLYCYSERGELALVRADPSAFRLVSNTRVTMGSEQHWAHPVIYDGVLYVRHGQALIAYRNSL